MKKVVESVVSQNIFEAASEGNLVRVRELLGQGVDVNQVDKSGFTALFTASLCDNVDVVSALLAEEGIRVNLAAEYGGTPLYCASKSGHVNVVRVLLADRRVRVNEVNLRDGSVTALHVASRKNHVEVVAALLAHDIIDVNKIDESTYTALYLASREGHVAVVSALLAHPAIDPNIAGFFHRNTPLHVAINNDHTDVVMALLASGKVNLHQQNRYYDTPLDCAVCENNVALVKKLIEKKAAISSQLHVLLLSAKDGYLEIFRLLLRYGVDPYCNEGSDAQKKLIRNFYRSEIRRESRRQWGRLFCQSEKVLTTKEVKVGLSSAKEQLLAFVRDFPGLHQLVGGMILRYYNAYTAVDELFKVFYDACFTGDQATVDRLLSAPGVDVDQTMREPRLVVFDLPSIKPPARPLAQQALLIADHAKRADNDEERPVLYCTALHVASAQGHESVVDRLLEVEGIDVNVATDESALMPFKFGLTPLYLACQEGHDGVVGRLLSAKGINVNKAITKEGGGTPLFIACQVGHAPVVERLLSAPGIDVREGRIGLPPLHIACFEGNAEIVLQLIKAGAPIEDRGSVDVTALMLARENGHKEVEEVLLAAGAVDQVAEESAAPSFSS